MESELNKNSHISISCALSDHAAMMVKICHANVTIMAVVLAESLINLAILAKVLSLANFIWVFILFFDADVQTVKSDKCNEKQAKLAYYND